MSIEKRGAPIESGLLEHVKMADDGEEVVMLNLDGFTKYGSGKDKEAVVIIATGPRAVTLRRFVTNFLEP